MFTFTLNIIAFNLDGSITVEYVPDDPDCFPIAHGVNLDLVTMSSKESILSMLKSTSPQHFWSKQKALKAMSTDHIAELIGSSHVVTELPDLNNQPAVLQKPTGSDLFDTLK